MTDSPGMFLMTYRMEAIYTNNWHVSALPNQINAETLVPEMMKFMYYYKILHLRIRFFTGDHECLNVTFKPESGNLHDVLSVKFFRDLENLGRKPGTTEGEFTELHRKFAERMHAELRAYENGEFTYREIEI